MNPPMLAPQNYDPWWWPVSCSNQRPAQTLNTEKAVGKLTLSAVVHNLLTGYNNITQQYMNIYNIGIQLKELEH